MTRFRLQIFGRNSIETIRCSSLQPNNWYLNFSHYWWSNLEYLRWCLTAFPTAEFSVLQLTGILCGDALVPCKHFTPPSNLYPLDSASVGASCPTWLWLRWCRMVTFHSAVLSTCISWHFFVRRSFSRFKKIHSKIYLIGYTPNYFSFSVFKVKNFYF